MLMLCVYLYEWLPQYLPKKSVEFAGPLHATVVRKVLTGFFLLLSDSLRKLHCEFLALGGNKTLIPGLVLCLN